jgi:hypothetical protein
MPSSNHSGNTSGDPRDPSPPPQPLVLRSGASITPTPLWNPRTGIFDPAQLRLAIVMRGWTVGEFANAAKVSRGCFYNALLGSGVTDRTAIRIFQTLASRDPFSLTL